MCVSLSSFSYLFVPPRSPPNLSIVLSVCLSASPFPSSSLCVCLCLSFNLPPSLFICSSVSLPVSCRITSSLYTKFLTFLPSFSLSLSPIPLPLPLPSGFSFLLSPSLCTLPPEARLEPSIGVAVSEGQTSISLGTITRSYPSFHFPFGSLIQSQIVLCRHQNHQSGSKWVLFSLLLVSFFL